MTVTGYSPRRPYRFAETSKLIVGRFTVPQLAGKKGSEILADYRDAAKKSLSDTHAIADDARDGETRPASTGGWVADDDSSLLEDWIPIWKELLPRRSCGTLLKLSDTASLRPGFGLSPARLAYLVVRGETIDLQYRDQESPNLQRLARYFTVLLPAEIEPFAALAFMRSLGGVEDAYVASGLEVPLPASGFLVETAITDRPLRHLSATGLDLHEPLATGGNKKPSVRVADIEYDWNLDHESLVSPPTYLDPTGQGWPIHHQALQQGYPLLRDTWSHGTASLGTVAGQKGNYRGVAPGVAAILSPVGLTPVGKPYSTIYVSIHDAIARAAHFLAGTAAAAHRGDVLLVEMQTQRNGIGPLRPCEFEFAVWDAIRLASANGITVVEPTGNGGISLSSTIGGATKGFPGWPNDSNAVMVGGAKSGTPHVRASYSGFGIRVDCFAWCERVVASSCDDLGAATSKQDSTLYYNDFGGTSAAAALIAGAAAAIQQLAHDHLGGQLPPRLLRALIGDPKSGVTAVFGGGDGLVGVMPKLRKLQSSPSHFADAVRDAWANADMSGPAPGSGTPDRELSAQAWNAYAR